MDQQKVGGSGQPGPPPLATVTRIPLTITATASGQTTDGVLVAVMAADLDRLEARLTAAEAVIDNIRAPQAAVDNDGYWDALKAYRLLQAEGR